VRVNQPLVDVLSVPNGPRISQLLFGEGFEVSKSEGNHSLGKAGCGYEGWVPTAALASSRAASHRVTALATYVYAKPDMKSELRLRLPYLAQVKVVATTGLFAQTPEGYVFAAHLSPTPAQDFVAEAERFIGIPYLWGGRSSSGVDCSGLVQLALLSTGVITPRDSGPKAVSIGKPLPLDAPLQRGDLIFWQGHVGIMQNATTLLHATAFSTSVMVEPLEATVARVQAQGYGEVTAIRRV